MTNSMTTICHRRSVVLTGAITNTILSKRATCQLGRVLQQLVVVLLLLLVPINTVLWHTPIATAYPTGAGSCLGGQAAVNNSSHVNPLYHLKIRGGSLADGGVIVKILQSTLGVDLTLKASNVSSTTKQTNDTTTSSNNNDDDNNSAVTLVTNTDYTIAVIGTQYVYKGCLIRLEGLDNQTSISNALEPNTNTRRADDVCSADNVVGITHNSSTFKQQHTGILRLDDPGDIKLDVTIVGVNNESVSLYAYNHFTVTFVNAPQSPTATTPPVAVPVATPVSVVPVSAPVTPPVPTTINNNNTTIDEQYVESVNETVTNISVTYENVATMSLADLKIFESITNTWFEEFYNVRSSQLNGTTGTSTSTAASTAITNRLVRRFVQESSNTTTTPPPQAFVVQGTMISVIDNVQQQASSLNNIITYNHQLTYKIYSSNSPYLPSSMTGPNNYIPLSAPEYAVLPYLSTSGNTDLVTALQEQLPSTFGNMVTPIADPVVQTETPPPDTDTNPTQPKETKEDNKMSKGLIAGIVIGCIAFVALLALIVSMRNDKGGTKKDVNGGSGGKSEEQTNFSAGNNYNPATGRNNNNDISSSHDMDSQFTSPYASEPVTTTATTTLGGRGPQPTAAGSSADPSSVFKKPTRSVYNNNNNNNIAPADDPSSVVSASDYAVESSHATSSVAGGTTSLSMGSMSVGNSAVQNNSKVTESDEYIVYAPSGKLGIVVDNPDDDSGPIIYAIKETSPLLDSKLNVGDRLIMVDEVDVTKMAPALISKLISRRANNPMRKLTLLRTKEPHEERMAM